MKKSNNLLNRKVKFFIIENIRDWIFQGVFESAKSFILHTRIYCVFSQEQEITSRDHVLKLAKLHYEMNIFHLKKLSFSFAEAN